MTARPKDTVVCIILDRSGSMDAIKGSVVSSFNEFLNELRGEKGRAFINLTLFDSVFTSSKVDLKTVYEMTPLEEVKDLKSRDYQPRGGTPLYDAVVETVEKLEREVEGMDKPNVLVAIVTDGEENSSVKYNEKDLAAVVKELEERGNWTFTYLAANQDAFATASDFASGTNLASNSYDFVFSEQGFKSASQQWSKSAQWAMRASADGQNVSLSNLKEKYDSSTK